MADPVAPIDPGTTPAATPEGAAPQEQVLGAIDPAAPAAPTVTAAPAPAPADVVYDLKFAEGLPVNDELVGEMKAFAKEHGMKPEGAQKVADFAGKFAEHMAEKHMGDIRALQNQWADSARADAEYGGEKFTENMAGANAALQRFGNLELTKVLKESGLANHPEVIRVFHNINKLISQDSVAAAISASTSAAKSPADRFYG